jgi:hypothetical protein
MNDGVPVQIVTVSHRTQTHFSGMRRKARHATARAARIRLKISNIQRSARIKSEMIFTPVRLRRNFWHKLDVTPCRNSFIV